jgi:glucan phosphoethanolaminetransferase (alkaline phosphatase superfamily)
MRVRTIGSGAYELQGPRSWVTRGALQVDARRSKPWLNALLGPVLLSLLDLGVRHRVMREWSVGQWLAWLGSLVLSALLWLAAGAALRAVARRSRPLALSLIVFLALVAAIWLGSSLAFFGEFSLYPGWSELAFLIEEATNFEGTVGLFSPWLEPSSLLVLVAMFAAFGWLGVRTLEPPPLRFEWSRGRASACVLAGAVLLAGHVTFGDVEAPRTPDTNFLVSMTSLASYYAKRTKGSYYAAERSRVPELRPARAPLNVVFVVQESLGRRRMSLYGYERPTTPRLEAWARSEPESLAVFRRGFTNSGNTGVVLPGLFTGLPPSASLEALHTAPFLWQYARAAGYRTLLLSAQSFKYASFADYFLSTPPERWFTADKEGAALVNGGGMDDRVFMEHVYRELDLALSDTRPFFAVIQYNATHHPILKLPPQAPELAGTSREDRYDNAVALLDRLLDDVRRRLSDKGVLDRTLIVVTSDHGECLGEHPVHRTQSYYDEVLAIPILVYVPERMKEERPEAVRALFENRALNVQNLDLPPTLLDAMGLFERAELRALTKAMVGHSLFRAVPRRRVIYALNNTATRHWTNEGFGLLLGEEKYVFSERGGHEFYDLLRDRDERHNLWPLRSEPPRWVVDALAAKGAEAYRALLERHTTRRDPLRLAIAKNALGSGGRTSEAAPSHHGSESATRAPTVSER